jgi:lipopolysaccharide/colanic/teichoic acid biosynthesis glycosyltransferase
MNSEWDIGLDEARLHTKVRSAARTPRAYLRMKRYLDIALASLGLLVLTPIFLFVALMIKLENPKAPVFFYQLRVGKNGKLFRMYKFRSMVTNAEDLITGLLRKNEAKGHLFKIKDDPRITRVGKIIRKTSIDELPQLFNVLRGDMSLVGPRPPLIREAELYSPYHMQRLQVIPGCTGLWQVSGRSNLDFDQMIELDLRYISERCLLLDLKIIIKTFRVLLGDKGAY